MRAFRGFQLAAVCAAFVVACGGATEDGLFDGGVAGAGGNSGFAGTSGQTGGGGTAGGGADSGAGGTAGLAGSGGGAGTGGADAAAGSGGLAGSDASAGSGGVAGSDAGDSGAEAGGSDASAGTGGATGGSGGAGTGGVSGSAGVAGSGGVSGSGGAAGTDAGGGSAGTAGSDAGGGCTKDADCDDGDACNGVETCDTSTGVCVAGTPLDCDDAIPCTLDTCDPTLGCVHVPDDSACGCNDTCDPQTGCNNGCVVTPCQGHVYECGNCLDDDGDCLLDAYEPECTGACDDHEDSYASNYRPDSPCKQDCYFDQDGGSGNDDCYWSHACDPHEVFPDYDPSGSKCSYNPDQGIAGTSKSCAELYSAQSAQCLGYCLPLVPNGCDCFGCCLVPGASEPVFLGSLDPTGNGTCDMAHLDDPMKCRPCEQVPSCLNPCDHCELCLGKTTLPADCTVQDCPAGAARCGLPGQAPCDPGYYCVTGCCQPTPL